MSPLRKLNGAERLVVGGRRNLPFICLAFLRHASYPIDMHSQVSLFDSIQTDEVVSLYMANGWSSGEKPDLLLPALRESHSLATARLDGELIGLANTVSDGHLVVYFPHMLVHPRHQRKGVGRLLMQALLDRYKGFHQLMLTADGDAITFYESMGFSRAGKTVPMWV